MIDTQALCPSRRRRVPARKPSTLLGQIGLPVIARPRGRRSGAEDRPPLRDLKSPASSQRCETGTPPPPSSVYKGFAPIRQAGGHWFEPSTAHLQGKRCTRGAFRVFRGRHADGAIRRVARKWQGSRRRAFLFTRRRSAGRAFCPPFAFTDAMCAQALGIRTFQAVATRLLFAVPDALFGSRFDRAGRPA